MWPMGRALTAVAGRRRVRLGAAVLLGAALAAAAEPPAAGDAREPMVPPDLPPAAAQAVDELRRVADAGEPTGEQVYAAAEHGMAAVWLAAARLDPDRPTHQRPLLLLAEQAAGVRRVQRELLRLYDPPAYRAFYTAEGSRLQERLAQALHWTAPPPNLVPAMVLAAPEPSLAWLEAQADQAPQAPGRLLEFLRYWGSLAAMRREPQYLPRLAALGRRLADSPAVAADVQVLCGVLKFLGDLDCQPAAERVAAWLAHPNATVRAAAAVTGGRLGTDLLLSALLDRAGKEPDPAVQGPLVTALRRWPREAAAGEACRRLYERTASPAVRRTVLEVAASADWPAREPLVRQAFTAGDGAALVALTSRPVPGLEGELLRQLQATLAAGHVLDPTLIEAVATARVAAAVPVFVRLLASEQNLAMRLKLVFALQTIGGPEAGNALLSGLDRARDETETEYLIGALGHLRHEAALPRLTRLAQDPGAAMSLRAAAIWALGCLATPAARAELANLERRTDFYFAPPAGAPPAPHQDFHSRAVRPHLLLARFRAEPAAASEALERAFVSAGPLEQLILLAGIGEQQYDHPIIALGLESAEFAVLCTALAAAKAADPRKYRAKARQLAASPYIQALAGIGSDTWDLAGLLEEWR